VCQKTGEVLRLCCNYVNLAFIAQHEGDHERALHLVRQALHVSHDERGIHDTAAALSALAGSIVAFGLPQPAARMLGASEAALERMGTFYQLADKPEVDRIVGEVRAQLDDATFQAAWAGGREMALEEAVEYALNRS
jgi:hypothetical protein